MHISRRKFIKNAGTAAFALPLLSTPIDLDFLHEPLEVHLFSKHLHFLNIKEASQIAAEIGFSGLDLTVRPKGHVLPEQVTTELTKALKDITGAGSTCTMITTAIADANNSIDLAVIKAASKENIKYYRSNWFKYKKDQSLEESLDYYKNKIQELSELNKAYKIIGCYQNHSGIKIGASVWEIKKILESANQDFFGVQYDIRHAVAEGGKSWPNGIKLLRDQIKTIVLKDFKWGQVNGKWQIINVPIGEGMVDFHNYFTLLKKYGLKPPVSLHLEYPLGGAEKGKTKLTVDKKVVFDAMKKDLITLQKIWASAGS